MRIQSSSGIAVLIATTLLIIVVLAGVMYFLVAYNPSVLNEKRDVELQRLQASARVYHSRLTFYEGVCSDIGVREPYRCNDADAEYALEVPVEGVGYYCVDSSGFAGELSASIGDRSSCQ